MKIDARLHRQVEQHAYPLLFATISGAHLYGFPSPDSDYDLRGSHVLPLKEVVGLHVKHETVEKSGIHDGLEIDLVTHDVGKFFGLMLKKNGYVLEQVMSPLVVQTTPEHDELVALRERQFVGAVLVSDTESWVYKGRAHAYGSRGATGVMTEWQQFVQNQQRLGGTKPKLICMDLQPATTTQAPDRDDILNVGGFSDAVFSVVASFLGEGVNRFVTEVEWIEL